MSLTGIKFKSQGDQIDYTPGSAVTAGDVIVLGSADAGFVGVAKTDIAANAKGELAIRGVFNFVCAGAITVGTYLYLTVATGVVTATKGTGATVALGRAVAASTDSNTRVLVALGMA